MTDTPKPKRGRPRTMDTDRTLRSAMEAYWQKDPTDVSINRIAELAGVSKPALYREFGSEDGLMQAVLDLYSTEVLSDIFEILNAGTPFDDTLAALTHFASDDPKMETGCVFYKMRAGKHRLGPGTREMVDGIEAAALKAFEAFLAARKATGEWTDDQPPPLVARYILEQMGLALTQRAAGEDPDQIRATMALALSVLRSG
jgi:AcrR family transcriptional regulator